MVQKHNDKLTPVTSVQFALSSFFNR